MIDASQITGVILAGGRGARMGGVDKGLQIFNGVPLAQRALERLQLQVGIAAIIANRNIAEYEAFGVPVWRDAIDDFAGPLAGMHAALAHCTTAWLATAPCDSPLLPLDLVERLASAAQGQNAEIAIASAREDDGELRSQPVFCLLRAELVEHLASYLQTGGRKVQAWTALHRTVTVAFDQPGDDPRAFFNANTMAQLHRLERT